ncbi:CRISPR-associated endoribonuclease Cas6 [Flexithrix dorotheae]|uniref:CRISPR-associated endoribonuclease Cas6 n=1 Tax=Flexithrix dorotheae TaxID=70993 RepID=UPI0003649337|nr:CRISPR-associated endoribonuclease Cas6 [Flexithrix dorotheae]
MNLLITFEARNGKNLPLNYQIAISKWLKEGIGLSENFTFSNILLESTLMKATPVNINLMSRHLSIQASLFHQNLDLESIKNTLAPQEIHLNETNTTLSLKEITPLPEFSVDGKVQLVGLSPIIITQSEKKKKGKLVRYIAPDHPDYAHLFFKSLIRRYAQNELENGRKFYYNAKSIASMKLNVLGKIPKKKSIQALGPGEKISGYQFEFEIEAPSELVKFGLKAGFGEFNQLGFGCCAVA